MQPITAYTLPPDKLALAEQYALARHILYFAAYAVSAIVLVLLIRFRVAPRLRGHRLPVVIAAIYAITTAFDLPAEMCGHALSLHYGISIERWPAWFADWFKGQAIAFPLTILLVSAFYLLVRRRPQRWWLYAWMACVPLILFSVWVDPFVIEPLFNDFQPLAKEHANLIAPIEGVLHCANVSIPADRLFEMRASDKTTALNAYVSGFGSSKRVVLYDTIIRAEPEPALMTTFGHELGHYVLAHIPKGIGYASITLLIGFYLAYAIMRWFVARAGPRFDVTGAGDPGSLPVFALIALVLSFLADPVANAYSRRQEHQADAYSLGVVRCVVADPGQAAAQAFQIEGERDLEPPDPNPFVVFWLYSHPPVADRLRFSLAYKP